MNSTNLTFSNLWIQPYSLFSQLSPLIILGLNNTWIQQYGIQQSLSWPKLYAMLLGFNSLSCKKKYILQSLVSTIRNSTTLGSPSSGAVKDCSGGERRFRAVGIRPNHQYMGRTQYKKTCSQSRFTLIDPITLPKFCTGTNDLNMGVDIVVRDVSF